jgi:hypothetical protein
MLAVVTFPAGMFIGLGCAKVLSWPRAILLAVLSFGSLMGFVRLMVYSQKAEASSFAEFEANVGGIAMLSLWGMAIFLIGRRKGYWTRFGGFIWTAVACILSAYIFFIVFLMVKHANALRFL